MLDSLKQATPPTENGVHADQLGHPVRTAVRFPIRLMVTLQTPQGPLLASTEDISASGLLFTTTRMLEINTPIEFTMCMPAAVLGAEHDIVVHCIGRIVRYQQTEPLIQAAAVIDEYFFKA